MRASHSKVLDLKIFLFFELGHASAAQYLSKKLALLGGASYTPSAEINRDSMNHRAPRHPCYHFEHMDFPHHTNLARRVSTLDTDDYRAAQLGDGKETDDTTNRPESQTNHELFAEPPCFFG